jgi:hypothetical protein
MSTLWGIFVRFFLPEDVIQGLNRAAFAIVPSKPGYGLNVQSWLIVCKQDVIGSSESSTS